AEAATQIGEGCEIVNGIVSYGCRIFYGVKAVRFVMASHSQLKYGARLINSYLGSNATISCCEVLNSLIFPAHEQHHNNSFLCAAVVMGQSNIPAGATIGSNHNSRAADGEIVAGRGFWPGLCVSLKHNSKFASFTMIVKGDYLYELNIPLPFSLLSLNYKNDTLEIMPAYWFMHNMYALARNEWKYADRDSRQEKYQHLEFNYLAPDTINEIFTALHLLELFTGRAFYAKNNLNGDDKMFAEKGRLLLKEKNAVVADLEIIADGFENSKRKTVIRKAQKAYDAYKEMILFYGLRELINSINDKSVENINQIRKQFSSHHQNEEWLNIGGQLISEEDVKDLKDNIKSKEINSWDELHLFYEEKGNEYAAQKTKHALAALLKIENISAKQITVEQLKKWLDKAVEINASITEKISASRKKDYTNPFRKMVYESEMEMKNVLGDLDENSFVLQQKKQFDAFKKQVKKLKPKFGV
ncbi:MAG: DUF4954 family protein, partial [Parafilimonas sp.]